MKKRLAKELSSFETFSDYERYAGGDPAELDWSIGRRYPPDRVRHRFILLR